MPVFKLIPGLFSAGLKLQNWLVQVFLNAGLDSLCASQKHDQLTIMTFVRDKSQQVLTLTGFVELVSMFIFTNFKLGDALPKRPGVLVNSSIAQLLQVLNWNQR